MAEHPGTLLWEILLFLTGHLSFISDENGSMLEIVG